VTRHEGSFRETRRKGRSSAWISAIAYEATARREVRSRRVDSINGGGKASSVECEP
jgi:hypothetical protein